MKTVFKALASLVVIGTIATGISFTSVKSATPVATTLWWCKGPEHINNALKLSNLREGNINYITENCHIRDSRFGSATATVVGCFITKESKDVVITQLNLQGIKGFRYSYMDKDTLRKMLTFYATDLKCKYYGGDSASK